MYKELTSEIRFSSEEELNEWMRKTKELIEKTKKDMMENLMTGKKERRVLQNGEKIIYEAFDGEEYIGTVLRQENSMLRIQEYVFHVKTGKELRCRDYIHRSQVRKTFKKVKKKPLIVWISESAIGNLKLGHSGTVYPEAVNNLKTNLVPCRPLTKREREKWGV